MFPDANPACGPLSDDFGKALDGVNIYDIFGYCYGNSAQGKDPNVSFPEEVGFSVVNGQLKTFKKAYSQK